MKIKNYKGFAAVELILVVVIISLLSGIGYYVYSLQSSAENTDNSYSTQDSEDPISEAELPEGFSRYGIGDTGINLVYPTEWGQAEELSDSVGGGYGLNDFVLSIEDRDSLQISRSFNAPSFCKYNISTDSWTESGQYPPSSCEPTILETSGVKSYGFPMGALGAYGYTYTTFLKSGSALVVSDSILADGTINQPEEYPTQSDVDALKTALDKNLGLIVSNNTDLFE